MIVKFFQYVEREIDMPIEILHIIAAMNGRIEGTSLHEVNSLRELSRNLANMRFGKNINVPNTIYLDKPEGQN